MESFNEGGLVMVVAAAELLCAINRNWRMKRGHVPVFRRAVLFRGLASGLVSIKLRAPQYFSAARHVSRNSAGITNWETIGRKSFASTDAEMESFNEGGLVMSGCGSGGFVRHTSKLAHEKRARARLPASNFVSGTRV
ncbi:hypothetical protein CDAR_256451 [Caerostris darwini]|uniref:Uncharacterized protein n=1 Tax=Caerostris darwini TaxID=1538125 RepID=A0AAV4SCC0_9ARAC|nr:hypothetical protein CDAR_256451 [Caerostris darwini]